MFNFFRKQRIKPGTVRYYSVTEMIHQDGTNPVNVQMFEILAMPGRLEILCDFLSDANKWCKGSYHVTAAGFSTLSLEFASRFCLVGAIAFLFPPVEARLVKTHLEWFLLNNVEKYLKPDVLNPPKNSGTEPRKDFYNLAKFNDESKHDTVAKFLKDAVQATTK